MGDTKDAMLEKLDIIIEEQDEQRELIEEILEKLADLEKPYGDGFTTYEQ